MKHLQTYRVFETAQTLTDEQKKFLDKNARGTWSLNPATGKVDVDGDFRCGDQDLRDFKGISFGSVSKNFDCSYNSLQTLAGAPETVGGSFSCYNNSLRTLEGAPRTVGGSFECFNNSLQTLGGAPKTVGRSFDCFNNSLRTLEGAPRTVKGSFDCSYNSLQSLKGAPKSVGRSFDCSNNDLLTLEGAPETVGRKFYSDDIKIPEGEWSQETLIQIFETGAPKQRQMVAPLIDPKVLQKMIDKDPEKMLMKLKDYLKDPHFKDLKWPKHLDQEKDLLSDLSDVGL